MTLSRSCGGEGSVPPAGEGRDLRGQRWPRASAEPPAPDTETRAAVGTSPHMREAARGQRGPGSAFLVREKVVLSPSTFHYADGGARAPPAAALGPRGSAVPSCDLRARVPRFPWAASIARPPQGEEKIERIMMLRGHSYRKWYNVFTYKMEKYILWS